MTYTNDTGFPSVTEILSPWIDKSWFTEEHAERGSMAHAAVAAEILGLYYPPIRQDWKGYVTSALRWIDDMVQDALLVEERLVDPHRRFCGKPDLLARLKDNTLCLVDFKTSKVAYNWWPIQVAAYRALASIHGHHTTRGLCLRLREDGGPALVTEYTSSHNRNLNVFHSALNTHHYFHGERKAA
jgi:hypothetical protein